jgi:putative hemolysin
LDSQSLLYIILAIVGSAFFSGVEMAYVSANKLYFELQGKQGVITGGIISKFLKQPSQFIGTMLIGNTLCLVLYGIFMEGSLHHFFEEATWFPEILKKSEVFMLIIPSLIATIIILATAEYTPKSIFLLNPDGFLEVLAIPIWLIYHLMSPLVFIMVGTSKWFIINVLRLDYSEQKLVFRLTDLNNYMQNLNRRVSTDEENEVDTKIFNNALEFKQVKVRDCMIPRTEITAVNHETTVEELKKVFVASGHSKVLVYENTIEDVSGYVHQLSLFKKPKDINSVITPIMIVPEAMPANDLMVKFTQERKSLALVVDEFGGTSGLISMEDIVEQIFGEIQDEFDDTENWVERKIDDNTYIMSARHEIEYLNDKYNWNLPEGDYDTLGGLVIHLNEDLPEMNEVIQMSPFSFTITDMEDAKLNTIKVQITGELKEKDENRSFSGGH